MSLQDDICLYGGPTGGGTFIVTIFNIWWPRAKGPGPSSSPGGTVVCRVRETRDLQDVQYMLREDCDHYSDLNGTVNGTNQWALPEILWHDRPGFIRGNDTNWWGGGGGGGHGLIRLFQETPTTTTAALTLSGK